MLESQETKTTRSHRDCRLNAEMKNYEMSVESGLCLKEDKPGQPIWPGMPSFETSAISV